MPASAEPWSCPSTIARSPRCYERTSARVRNRSLSIAVAVYISASARDAGRFGDCTDSLLLLARVVRSLLPAAAIIVVFDAPHANVLRGADSVAALESIRPLIPEPAWRAWNKRATHYRAEQLQPHLQGLV